MVQAKNIAWSQGLPSNERETCVECYEIIFRDDSELMFQEHHRDRSFIKTDLESESYNLLKNFNGEEKETFARTLKRACKTILKYWAAH